MSWVDRTAEVQRNAVGRNRVKGYRFDTASIDAVVLHQMGFNRSSDGARFDSVCAHFAVLLNGTVLLLHRIDEYLYASNAFNSRSIAIEFEGAFPSERGRWHHAVEDSQRIRPKVRQLTAGRELVGRLASRLSLSYVFAHRQSNSPNKSNCPGPHIWYNIGEYFVSSGRLSDGGYGYHLSDGDPIPDEWRDPAFRLL